MKLTALAIAFLTTVNPLAVQNVPPADAPSGEIYFELYAANQGPFALRLIHREPMPGLVGCYALGALAMQILEEVRPERRYRGRCGDTGELLTVDQLITQAQQSTEGEK